MKMQRFVVFMLVLSVIMSGCSRMGMSFSKRKYRSGYYMDFASRHKVQHYPSSKTFKEHSQDFMGHYASLEPMKPHETLAPDPSKQQEKLLEHPYITANHQHHKFYQTPLINIESIKLHSILNDNPTTELPEKKGQEFLYAAIVVLIVLIFLVRQSLATSFLISPLIIIGLLLLVLLLFIGYINANKNYYTAKKIIDHKDFEEKKKFVETDFSYLKRYAIATLVLGSIFLFGASLLVLLSIISGGIFLSGDVGLAIAVLMIYPMLGSFIAGIILGAKAINGMEKHPEVNGKIYAIIGLAFILVPAGIGILIALGSSLGFK